MYFIKYMSKHVSGQREPIGILVAAVRRRIRQIVAARVSRYGLTPQQFLVLVAAYEHEGCSLGEITGHVWMDQPTASRVIAALARRKRVRVEADPGDRRRGRLFLTPGGRALARKLHPVALEIRSAAETGLDSSERDTLRALLAKVIANIERYDLRGPGESLPGV
jgi:DNA-binding MarR family transcriptional regulator